ncbi:hypothetical protein FQZ97_552630 [compost metagenome]
MKISIASMFSNRDTTIVLPWLMGSKKDANDRPICRPMYSPAASTAVKMRRIEKPMAAPISTCCTMIQRPPADTTGTAGSGPSVGEITNVSTAAMPTFTWRVAQGSPNTGAVETMASMRTKGQRKATSQASSWPEVTEKTEGVTPASAGCWRTGRACSRACGRASTARR